ncbi:MAG: hypothetical protein ACYT04_71630 [Nostoc sp.]
MKNLNIKEEARKLIDKLPENSTWDDLMYQIYVRQTVEAGLTDSKASNVISVQDIKPEQIDVLAVIHGSQQITLSSVDE